MKIKIIHISDLEPNPTLQAEKYSDPWKGLQIELGKNPHFRRDTWNWLFDSTIDLLDRIKRNKGKDQQLLLISGDVVKGFGTDNIWVMNGWDRLHNKLKEIANSGTKIILTTGSHDTRAIEQQYPTRDFYNSIPYNNYKGDPESPWIVITNPRGERLDLCNDQISIIGYGDLDGVRNDANGIPVRINEIEYREGREHWAHNKSDLSPRFVIGMSPDHGPDSGEWAGYNIYCYIATGGTEGHDPLDHDQFKKLGNDHFIFSRQGSPYRCVGFDKPPFQQMILSFSYGIVDTEKRVATFKDLSSDTPTDEFSVEGGITISYNPEP